MTSDGQKPASGTQAEASSSESDTASQPEWADGLKQLYDSVVDEPLPDAFTDLLSKLDDSSAKDAAQSDNC